MAEEPKEKKPVSEQPEEKKPVPEKLQKLAENFRRGGKKLCECISGAAGKLKEEWGGATKPAKMLVSVFAAAAVIFFLLFIIQSARISGISKEKKSAEALSKNLQEEVSRLQEELKKQENGQIAAAEGPTPFLEPTAAPTSTPVPTSIPERHYLVCVDAGHGGFDGGAVLQRNGIEERIESQDNLALAKLFQKALEERKIEVRMTRSDDTFLELEERTGIANNVQADLLISLHRNSFYDANGNSNDDVQGVEIWLHNSKPQGVTQLAEAMLASMEAVGITKNRGVKYGTMGDSQYNYAINSKSAMGSMIVEMGFITCSQDNLNFDLHGEEYANAMADAVEQWLKENISLE